MNTSSGEGYRPQAALVTVDESEWIPISALEHWSYCRRQYALIHVEATYDENAFTLRGRFIHERAHDESASTDGFVPVERDLPVCSWSLGLTGKADVVEFHDGAPYPVEYKSGPDVVSEHADLQVCAQALCLEEMTGEQVPRGAVFHHASRRRREVVFDEALRTRVKGAIAAIRAYDWSGPLPPPVSDGRCRSCSLAEACLPAIAKRGRVLKRLADELYMVE